MSVTLDDAWTKLNWAKKYFESIRPDIETFEERDDYTISFDVDPDEGKYTFYVHGLQTPDPDWGLVIGDCLHNARTALDYLIVRLVALVTQKRPSEIDWIDFPIHEDPERFKRVAAKVREHPGFSGYLTRIEELQPFNNRNPSVWGFQPLGKTNVWPFGGPPNISPLPNALLRLSQLDNIDKHRLIHAVWLGGKAGQAFKTFPGIPADFRPKGGGHAIGPLEDGAEVGSLKFTTPLPHEWHPDEMDMKRHFKPQVALEESAIETGVLKVLPFCLWGVESVLTLFEPVFSHGAAPLPVTSMGQAQPWNPFVEGDRPSAEPESGT